MQKHTKVYFAAMGYSPTEFIPCEMCGCSAVDIHHIEPRSRFGSKTKHLQDDILNLIALCRSCHDLAHSNEISKYDLTERHKITISLRSELIKYQTNPIKKTIYPNEN